MVERDAAQKALMSEPPLSGEKPLSGEVLRSSMAEGARPAASETALPAFTSLALVAVHEISNVLGWLNMTLELIERTELARARGEATSATDPTAAIHDARMGVKHMSAIVHELRSFGRPAAGADEAFDPAEALNAAVRFAEARIVRRAHLRQSLAPMPPVRGSRHELTCVFLNLLLNAAEAISEGSPDANVVGVRASTDEAGRAVVEVEDTGRGIASEVGEHVFDAYFTGRAKLGGTGLGLDVSRRIARAMGGEISFESAPGLGSLFRVELPPASEQAGT